jgi:hypothetical protein
MFAEHNLCVVLSLM